MSLNIKYTETKPCVKPYELTLNDCLACSSCLTQGESDSLISFNFHTIKDYEKITITPHAKINLSNQFQIPLKKFEDLLNSFFENKIIDTSNYYKYIVCNDENNIITSECPGVVKYIQRSGHHLIDNLMKIMSTQQIINEEYNCLHIVTCLDKRLENPQNYITTREIYKYMLDSGFEWCETQKNESNSSIHRMIQVDLNYIESICTENASKQVINGGLIEYKDGNKLYAKIYGLPNFMNFVKRSKNGIKYDVVEAYICNDGCINGPAQIKDLLTQDKNLMAKQNSSQKYQKTYHNSFKRTFSKEQTKAKTYKVDW